MDNNNKLMDNSNKLMENNNKFMYNKVNKKYNNFYSINYKSKELMMRTSSINNNY